MVYLLTHFYIFFRKLGEGQKCWYFWLIKNMVKRHAHNFWGSFSYFSVISVLIKHRFSLRHQESLTAFRADFNWQNRSIEDFIQSSLKWETFYCLSKLLLIQRTSVKLLISIPRLIQNLSSHFKKTVKLGSGRLFNCLMFNVCKFFNLKKTLSFLPDGILFFQSNKTWGIEICGIGRGSRY